MNKLILASAMLLQISAFGAWKVQSIEGPNGQEIISSQVVQKSLNSRGVINLQKIHRELAEMDSPSEDYFVERIYSDATVPREALLKVRATPVVWAGSEVKTLIGQGPKENRINLTIVGDGYTEAERIKFFEDAQRITDDLFKENTFASYLSLFNVYAVFVPSIESGLTDRVKKNTALGLYRTPVGSKRGIRVGNSSAARRAIALAPATDYPILIANDDYYGGLGGEFAITTRSLTSGSMVLRHELGHNFGNVGEEYDGGSVYSGANSTSTANRKWTHWIDTETANINEGKQLTGAYVWQNLTNKEFKDSFRYSGAEGSLFGLQLSSVGWQDENQVSVLLDNKPLEIDGTYTVDRSFFYTELEELNPGSHTIKIKDLSQDGDNVLAFANAYAYPPGYEFEDVVGYYATYNSWGSKFYRPTHEHCLMRDMRTKQFCSVDQENMWVKFLSRINLVDKVDVSDTKVRANVLDIDLKLTWYKEVNGSYQELIGFSNQVEMDLPEESSGRYKIRAEFISKEVRVKNSNFIQEVKFSI